MTGPRQPASISFSAFRSSDSGSSLVEIALLLPLLLFLLFGVIDIGRGYYLALEVQDAAEAGALYGLKHESDLSGMQTASSLDAPDLGGNLTTTSSYGCECPDGTSPVSPCTAPPVGCSSTWVNYVQVKTAYTYRAAFPYPGIPTSYALQGSVTLRAN